MCHQFGQRKVRNIIAVAMALQVLQLTSVFAFMCALREQGMGSVELERTVRRNSSNR
jgi:hypothetical protein